MHSFRVRSSPLIVALTLAFGPVGAAAADQQPPPSAEKPQPPPGPPPGPLPPSTANVKVDITISDQAGTAKPITKTISIIVADRTNSQIRSQVNLPVASRRKISPKTGEEFVDPNWRMEELPLNIDARPEVLDANRVRMRLLLNYRTATESTTMDGQPPRTSAVTEDVVSVFESGKPTIVSQSADAATDRKVTVEVKATIQR